MRATFSFLAMLAGGSTIPFTEVWSQSAVAGDAVRLVPGDLIRLEVQFEPKWSGDFSVGADGAVFLPLLGAVRVTGRSFGEVREEVGRLLARELVNPAFRVTPIPRIAVLGEVRAPGLFPVDGSVTLSALLAQAGGLLPSGDPNKVALVREGKVVQARLAPGSTTLHLGLQSGDQIMVGRRGWLRENTPFLIGVLGSLTTALVAGLVLR